MVDQQVVRERDDMDIPVISQGEITLTVSERFDVRFQKAMSKHYEEAGPTRFRGNGRIVIRGARISFDGKAGWFGWL